LLAILILLFVADVASAQSFTITRSGNWIYSTVTDVDEYTHGSLTYKRQSVYGGQVNDYRKTPWGTMYWLGDWPSRGWRLSGWMKVKHSEWPDGNNLDEKKDWAHDARR